jgi:ATP-dependent DNA helicase RecG
MMRRSPADPSSQAAAPLNWDDPVTELMGVGPVRAESLAALGIRTIGDLLSHYPSRYEDRRNILSLAGLRHGETAVVRVRVTGKGRVHRRGRRSTVRTPVTDGDTLAELVWFNQPYRASSHVRGDRLLVVGTARIESGKTSITVREVEPDREDDGPHDTGGIVPVYRATEGLAQRGLRELVAQALRRCERLPDDPIPEDLRVARGLVGLSEALPEVHFPTSDDTRRVARRRMAYQELFALQLVLALRRRQVKSADGGGGMRAPGAVEELAARLPFELTGAQRRVIAEVAEDLAARAPAHRLIHGEVGSGKTVIAAAALLIAVRSGAQAAVMAPTELLAEQHHATLVELLGPLGVEVGLLTGSLPAPERNAVREALASGELACVVGTHALISEGVEFANLGLAIIDEQHRFGVRQRARLTVSRGRQPDLLIMSATPIPRTLALTAWGDFDVSVLDELPPGRKRPKTKLVAADKREAIWAGVARRLAQGRQAYVVCPAIDESEELDIAAATAVHEELATGPLADWRVELIHGRMDAARRREVMARFRDGETDVLVATSLIEVGVDVPNATVMVIQSAERFGLAQLHQLRGRVSRASHQPHCLLLPGDCGPESFERLAAVARMHDGFEIAEEDLRRRGQGELDGTAQHGLDASGLGTLLADTTALAQAREDAFALVEADPDFAAPGHEGLAALAERIRNADVWTL